VIETAHKTANPCGHIESVQVSPVGYEKQARCVQARSSVCGVVEPTAEANFEADVQAPLLVFPTNGTVMDNSCSPAGSETIIWDFDWMDVTFATAYHLYVIGPSATVPVINAVMTGSEFSYVSGGYIPDGNRFGWEWKVRARNATGTWSDWPETRVFDVEPLNTDCTSCNVVIEDRVVNDIQRHESCGTLLAGPSLEVMAPEGDLTLCAANLVVLRNGVSVESGAKLTIEIDPTLAD